jgi:hypothetical protein
MFNSTSTAFLNAPAAVGFSLVVLRSGSTGTTQIWVRRDIANPEMWVRVHTTTSSAWGAWFPVGQSATTDRRRIFMMNRSTPAIEEFWHNEDVADHTDDDRRMTVRAAGNIVLYGISQYYFNKATDAVTSNYRQTQLRNHGDVIINAWRNNLTPTDQYTDLNDGQAIRRLRLTSVGGAGIVDCSGSRLTNAAVSTAIDDVPTNRVVSAAVTNMAFGWNKGELFPATVVANRAAMNALLGTPVENATEGFETSLGTTIPVISNTQPAAAGGGAGWERSNARAGTGSWSIVCRNTGFHSTTATIIFDIGVCPEPYNITFQYWWDGESCCDWFEWALLNTSNTVIGAAINTANTTRAAWINQIVPITADRIGLGHRLRFQYRKDGSVHSGEDRAFVDQIAIRRTNPAMVTERAWAFPEGTTYVHGYLRAGRVFETVLTAGQTFRDVGAAYQLKLWNGSAIVNV